MVGEVDDVGVVDVDDVELAGALVAMSCSPERLMTLLPTLRVGPLEPFVTPVTTPVMVVPFPSMPVTVLPINDAASLICDVDVIVCICSTCESWAI